MALLERVQPTAEAGFPLAKPQLLLKVAKARVSQVGGRVPRVASQRPPSAVVTSLST